MRYCAVSSWSSDLCFRTASLSSHHVTVRIYCLRAVLWLSFGLVQVGELEALLFKLGKENVENIRCLLEVRNLQSNPSKKQGNLTTLLDSAPKVTAHP